jgi:hypothetical protein
MAKAEKVPEVYHAEQVGSDGHLIAGSLTYDRNTANRLSVAGITIVKGPGPNDGGRSKCPKCIELDTLIKVGKI